MKSDETQTLRYRLDTDTYEAIKYDIVPATDRWNSVSEFTKSSIQKQVNQLISTARGGRQANKLIRRLSGIDGIEEQVPEEATKPSVEDQTLDKSLSVELPIKDFKFVDDLVHQTYLNKSNVAGYCIFRQISRGDTPRNGLDDWYEKEAYQTWDELKISLLEPQLRLHSILTKRFRIHEMTSHFIRQDPSEFEGFAEVYHNGFYGTDQYDTLKEKLDSHTFNAVENTIEEYTEYSFEDSTEDTEFLEDCLGE